MIKPRRLKASDLLHVVMPASSLKFGSGVVKDFESGLKQLQKKFKVNYSASPDSNYFGFSATDRQRAKEINDAVRSPRVGGIIAGRGGYGSLRILGDLDFQLIRQRPKPIIGLSDLTILQLAIYQRSQLITFSGPLVTYADEVSTDHLSRLLTGPTRNLDLIPEEDKSDVAELSEGSAEGILIGGNLFSMSQLAGTGLLPRFDNAILFFEDIDETVNRVDSYLQHLKLAGALYHVAGVVIGDLTWRKDQPTGGGAKSDQLLLERLEGMFRQGTPIISGVNYGHVKGTLTIPLGARAKLDTASRSLTLLEDVTDG